MVSKILCFFLLVVSIRLSQGGAVRPDLLWSIDNPDQILIIVEKNFDPETRQTIEQAFKILNSHSCIPLKLADPNEVADLSGFSLDRLAVGNYSTTGLIPLPSYYMILRKSWVSCSTEVGRNHPEHDIYLADHCTKDPIPIIHEVLHAFGAVHEMSRPDRNKYITVRKNNILEGKTRNFDIDPLSIGSTNFFDFDSILLYPSNKFSIHPDLPTMISTVKGKNVPSSANERISEGDIQTLKYLTCPYDPSYGFPKVQVNAKLR